MIVRLLKSKLHRARVTGGDVNYEGSLTISSDLMEAVGILPYEKVLVGNMANGERFETYAIPGARGKGEIVLNGGAALLGKKGDLVTIMTFADLPAKEAASHEPRKATLQEGNRLPRG
ncbi:MAG: aspartate 1-decarboxylase [Verrucomicrobiae bacterium]|nr:aspartate 1-decarboxylase [Verrucomicrobiae bacterium]